MKLPAEMVIAQLRQRLSDVEYENAILRARIALDENGLVELKGPTSWEPSVATPMAEDEGPDGNLPDDAPEGKADRTPDLEEATD